MASSDNADSRTIGNVGYGEIPLKISRMIIGGGMYN